MKTKLLYFILLGISLNLKSQNINFKLDSSYIKIENDTLYLKYKFKNNIPKNYIFYNLKVFDFKSGYISKQMPEIMQQLKEVTPMPRIQILLFNEKNQLPDNMLASTRHLTQKQIKENLETINKYEILHKNESFEYIKKIYVGNIGYNGVLKKGQYKIQLHYRSTDYYKDSFNRKKHTHLEFKNYELFVGDVYSNSCFVYNKKDIFLKASK